MIAVLIAKIVGTVRGCPAADYGAPCDWTVYAGVGMVAGSISLPVLALTRLKRRDAARHSARG
ncbi:MAG: hypothetical protein NVS4B3_26680 [Gemmatimonadaceae bacterium]